MKTIPLQPVVSRPRHLSWLVLLCLGILFFARASRAEDRVTFENSIGPVSAKGAASVRALDAAETKARTINFSVALQMRNFEHLEARVARGETVPAGELETAYLPLPNDYAVIKKWLEAEGFTVTLEDSSRLSVFVRGTLAQIERSFQTTMVGVTIEGVTYPTASVAPSLPKSIAAPVLGINGLQTFHHLHKHSKELTNAVPNDGYLINDILTTYDAAGLGVTGAGQTIAILIDTTPKTSDITSFWKNNGSTQTASNVTAINVNGGTLPGISGEETLDVEWSGGIAPGAKIRVYATGDLDDASLDAGFARIISDLSSFPSIHQLSISLGEGETYDVDSEYQTDHNYLTTIASQGVSTFVSAGDGGSTPDDTGEGNEDRGPLQVEYYASDPSVTGVGGTSLNVVSASNFARSSESAWSGSGGGESIVFDKPSWQTGTGVPGGTGRYVPDVAMPADPNTGAYVYVGGGPTVFGGTSWSAPTWAGFCALINEARANAGQTGGMGLLNPSLYPLIGTNDFHDITSGSNAEGSKADGKYSAGTGYDPVTGIGVPDVGKLMSTLVGTASTAPVITSKKTDSSTVGASYSYQITASNNPTSFTATGLPSGLSVNKTTGLISGTLAKTSAGTKTLHLSAANASGTGTATLTLTIASATPVINSPTTASATIGQPFSYQITATNNPSSYGATGLPKGLSVDTATGIISGTPASTASGVKTLDLKAINSSGTGTATLTLTVSK